ncbi:MAG: type 1 glutamine amidotransferase [Pseudomonadota bacterium]
MPVLTIIETGRAPERIRADWPLYPAMFESLLAPHLPGWSYQSVAVSEGEVLPDPATLDAVLITGSPAGIYDQTPWMAPLMDFIRWTVDAGVPQVGICFGHQAIAHALGAKVAKSDKGWGIGRHVYDVPSPQPWMQGRGTATFSLGVSHQDQVLSLPAGALQVARSDFCEYAALAYPGANAISFQGHPEFSPEFSCALYAVRKGTRFSAEMVEAAEESLQTEIDNDLVGQWIASFLVQNIK